MKKEFIVKKRKTKERVQTSFWIEEEVLERLKDIVAENNLNSVNELIGECIKYALKNIEIGELKE